MHQSTKDVWASFFKGFLFPPETMQLHSFRFGAGGYRALEGWRGGCGEGGGRADV